MTAPTCACQRLATDMQAVLVVRDNLAFEVAANPGMPAGEVLRRLSNVLPDIPPTPEGDGQR